MKVQLDNQSDPLGHVINLSKKIYAKVIFQLLNKGFNFISAPKVCNKHKLNKELESCHRLLELKALFKVNENNKLTMAQQIFKHRRRCTLKKKPSYCI